MLATYISLYKQPNSSIIQKPSISLLIVSTKEFFSIIINFDFHVDSILFNIFINGSTPLEN